VIIGLMVSGTSDIVEVVFMSLTAGTFTYISCSEVIIEEFSAPNQKLLKMFMFILGAVLISLLTVYLD
jgi:zinc transporter ZupT